MSLREKQKNKIQNDSVQLFSLTGVLIYDYDYERHPHCICQKDSISVIKNK